MTINQQVTLATRPIGMPKPSDFKLLESPVRALQPGEVQLKTLYLSLDPYMRGRLSDKPSYAPAMQIGDVMVGETIGEVVNSSDPAFQAGDVVSAYSGWQTHPVCPANMVKKIDSRITHFPYALGLLGMPGFTAYAGLLDIAAPKPDETLVVAAATGAVGAVVGQIGKIKGCRVIGIAGGAEKCRYAVTELGFDACIDHRAADFAEQLARSCSRGIDMYFENVGGAVLDAVWPLLNNHARVPVCGLIAHYNVEQSPVNIDRSTWMRDILTKSIRVQGFINSNYRAQYFESFMNDMIQWVAQGKIRYREDFVDGMENAVSAFIGLLQGKNFGKLMVRFE